MPYSRPTLQTIIDRIGRDIESKLRGADAFLRRAVAKILARAYAGAVHLLYGALDQVLRALFPDTATGTELERWGAIFTIFRKAATYASGYATAAADTGVTVPSGTLVLRSDGVEFETTDSAVGAGGVVTVPVQAREAGTAGNTDANGTLTIQGPIAGVGTEFTVDAPGLRGGYDIETDDELRGRILQRIQKPPQGGIDTDYERWLLEIPGITKALIFPKLWGGGTMGFSFIMANKTTLPELVRNGSFATQDNWVFGSAWAITGGKAVHSGAEPGGVMRQEIEPLVADRGYTTVFTVSDRTAGAVRLVLYPSGTAGTWHSADGTFTEALTAVAGDTHLDIEADASFVGAVDNVSAVDPTSPQVPSVQDLDAALEYVAGHTDPISGEKVGAPCTVDLFAFRVNALLQDFTVRLNEVDTPEIRLAVEAELEDLVLTEGVPTTGGGTLYLSHINAAISMAPGEVDHELDSPAADVAIAQNEFLLPGTVTWLG